MTFDGLTVYCFRFDCPSNIILAGGFNYWFSMQAVSGGSIFDRGVFLFKKKNNDCMDIHITGGVYKNPLAGFPDFTPVSDSLLEGEPREFAFRIYGSPLCPVGDDGGTGKAEIPGEPHALGWCAPDHKPSQNKQTEQSRREHGHHHGSEHTPSQSSASRTSCRTQGMDLLAMSQAVDRGKAKRGLWQGET